MLQGHVFACVGAVTESQELIVRGIDGRGLTGLAVAKLKAAWKGPFGELI